MLGPGILDNRGNFLISKGVLHDGGLKLLNGLGICLQDEYLLPKVLLLRELIIAVGDQSLLLTDVDKTFPISASKVKLRLVIVDKRQDPRIHLIPVPVGVADIRKLLDVDLTFG